MPRAKFVDTVSVVFVVFLQENKQCVRLSYPVQRGRWGITVMEDGENAIPLTCWKLDDDKTRPDFAGSIQE